MAKKRANPLTLQAQVDRFNKACPVGTAVTLAKDRGEIVDTKVRHPAEVLSGHTAVGWFDGISGCYLLDRVAKA